MLARKSRKNLVEKEVVKCDILKSAGYVRLSVNKTDHPSYSIENQKKIIEGYAETNWDIQFERFYVDDKASGRDFDRPAFNEMLEDIRAGKINCVIVKDLFRLGRDMIEVGYYIQMLFPSKGVRFISIGNKIDMLDGMINITFGELPGEPPVFCYRAKDKKETDLPLFENGVLYPVEVKKSASPGSGVVNNFKVLEPVTEPEKFRELEQYKVGIWNGAVVCMANDLLPVGKKDRYAHAWLI